MGRVLVIGWIVGVLATVKAAEPVRVRLLQDQERVAAGQAVTLGLKFELEPGWHTYWVNPGEAGMALSVEWDLPPGWVAGAVLYPVPERFTTGDLVGYGYAGEVVLPVVLTVADGAEGVARVGVELNWLSCDETRCVAGHATLETRLEVGETRPSAQAGRIEKALGQVPRPRAGVRLAVEDRGDELGLSLEVPPGVDLSEARIFPRTPEVIDPRAVWRLEPDQGRWTASVRPSDFLRRPIAELELVLAGDKLDAPIRVGWRHPGG